MTRYNIEEVQRHNTPSDLWVVIDNCVYNLSNYSELHPGGPIILSGAGSDCTVMFHHYHIVGKKKALAVLKKMKIGDLDGPASPVMGRFYDELCEAVGEMLAPLPKHPLFAQVHFFVDIIALTALVLLGLYLCAQAEPPGEATAFLVSFLTCAFSGRAAAQAHAVGHMQLFDKSFVRIAEKIVFIFGGRTAPIYALPNEEVTYRRLLGSTTRDEAQAEFVGGRGPFEHQSLHHVRGASLAVDSCALGVSWVGRLSKRSKYKYPLHWLQTTLIGRNMIYATGSAVIDILNPLVKVQYFFSMLYFHPIYHLNIVCTFIGVLFELAVVYVSWIWPAVSNIKVLVALIAVRQWTNFMILFFAQHVWDSDVPESLANKDWGKYNALTTISLSGESLRWWHPLYLGGNGTSPSTLTYHLEHTLFPGVNYMYLSKVAKITEIMCAKHKIRYASVSKLI